MTRRLLHVFATFGAGGPQMRAVELMRHLGADCEHHVMAMSGDTAAAARLPREVTVTLVPPPPRGGFRAVVRAQRHWLREQRPDLVLTYNWGAIETVAAARSLRLPLVHHEDGFGPEEVHRRLRRRSWFRRWYLARVPVIVPSQVLQQIALDEWRLRRANVHLLANGVDLARFAGGNDVGGGAGSPCVGTVGGLRAEKDHGNLLLALAQLGPDVHAELVGDGPLRAQLEQQANQLGLVDRVAFAGAIADPAPRYRRFTVFALASRTEQMPIAMLEAMASGLPVVATDVGDVRAILPPEQLSFVVPPGDPAALAAALRTLLGDAPLRQRLGAANRARCVERYAAATCLEQFARVYRANWRR